MKKVVLIILAPLLLATSAYTPFAHRASAVTAADWKAGRIIDDSKFTGLDMSVADIQNFLNSKVTTCDTWGTQPATEYGRSDVNHAQYAASRGWAPPPYVCLKNYYEVPKTAPGPGVPASSYGNGGNPPAGSISAAQMIFNAAQQYRISPKVLLVKLDTESAGPLTRDIWPLQKQYTYAMGAHCPDSGPGGAANCDPNYAGFSIQIAEAAKLLRYYLDNMDQTWWQYKKPFQTNNILWNVAPSGCGGGNVYLESMGTAALYTYTPYQPNQAALNNMYGTGNGCSAYGNRNFWRVYNDWFGPTSGTPFFQLPGSPATYMLGANDTYYSIQSYERLKDYGFESIFGFQVDKLVSTAGLTYKGNLPAVARFEGIGVYLMQQGKLRPFPSEDVFTNYGYSFGQEANISQTIFKGYPVSDPVRRIAAESDGKSTYYVSAGKKQAICNQAAYQSLGSPIYSTQPVSRLSTEYLSKLPDNSPIAMEGDVIQTWDQTKYGLWQNGILLPFDKSIAKLSGTANCAVSSEAIAKLPAASSGIINLIKDNVGKHYVIDGNKKLLVDSPSSVSLGAPVGDYVLGNDTFLNRLQTGVLKSPVRIGSSTGVYVLQNGKSYSVPSEQDFYGLGFSFNQVQSISQATLSLFHATGPIFTPGKYVRESNSNAVFLINESFKKHAFSSESVYLNYANNWLKVSVIPAGSLGNYQLSDSAGYFIKENDNLYWLMSDGVKHRIPTALVSGAGYNLTSLNTVSLPVSILSQYPMSSKPITKVFRIINTSTVYVIENGQKRAYKNENAFLSAGHSWSEVIPLNKAFIESLPTGQPIN